MGKLRDISGLILCLLITIISYIGDKYIPIGKVTLGILLGIIVSNILKLPEFTKKGFTFAEKKVLPVAIALLGLELNYTVFIKLGVNTLVIIILMVLFTIFIGVFWGKVFKIDSRHALLLGIGNAVCGSSAIMASQSVVKAEEEDVVLSVAIINFLGTIGIFLIPAVISLFNGIEELGKSIFVGTTLQAVGQVSAAGFTISDSVGQLATVVKMGRILMLTPLVLILGLINKEKLVAHETSDVGGNKLFFPIYIIFFLLLSIINSLDIIPVPITEVTTKVCKFLFVFAMTGIGMKINIVKLLNIGRKSVTIGVIIWLFQIVFGIVLLKLFALI